MAASELSWVHHLRLKYGPVISLIDLSPGGTQVETTDYQLQPGGQVVVQIIGKDEELVLPANVLRCHVSEIGVRTTYRGALEFKRLVTLPATSRGADGLATGRRILESAEPRPHPQDADELQQVCKTHVSETALAAARALIQAASRRRGAACAEQMTNLLRVVTRLVEQGTPRGEVIQAVIDRLRRSIPAASIRLVDASSFASVHTSDAVYFDVPVDAGRPLARLLIEFGGNHRLESWHLELPKMAVHLIAVAEDTEKAETGAVQPLPDPPAVPAAVPPGWRKVVVRYRDSGLLRAYCRGFQPSAGEVHVWEKPDGAAAARITVPLTQLKALFFVREFEGDASLRTEADAPVPPVEAGRAVSVTFLDGEVLTGTTRNYAPNGPGFFVAPTNHRSNNQQVFVAIGAVRHVRFA